MNKHHSGVRARVHQEAPGFRPGPRDREGCSCVCKASPSGCRDLGNPPAAELGRLRTSRVDFLAHFTHTTYSVRRVFVVTLQCMITTQPEWRCSEATVYGTSVNTEKLRPHV